MLDCGDAKYKPRSNLSDIKLTYINEPGVGHAHKKGKKYGYK